MNEPEKFIGLEGDVDLTAGHSGLVVEIQAEDHWSAVTLQQERSIVGLRNWIVRYCQDQGLG